MAFRWFYGITEEREKGRQSIIRWEGEEFGDLRKKIIKQETRVSI